jgi:hypothetical protein
MVTIITIGNILYRFKLTNTRGFQFTKECIIWILYIKVIWVQSFVGRCPKITQWTDVNIFFNYLNQYIPTLQDFEQLLVSKAVAINRSEVELVVPTLVVESTNFQILSWTVI